MAYKRKERPSWYKTFDVQAPIVQAAPDDAVGRAYKASLEYLKTKEVPVLDDMAKLIFAPMKEAVDEAWKDFEETCIRNAENRQKGKGKKETNDK